MKTLSTLILVVGLAFAGVGQAAAKQDKAKGKGQPAAAHAKGGHAGNVKARPAGKHPHASAQKSARVKAPKATHHSEKIAHANGAGAKHAKSMGWRGKQEKQIEKENRAALKQAGIKPGHNRVITPEIRTRAQNFKGRDYHQVLGGYSRARHDASYWQQNYDRIIVVNGGHYYWNQGYWYPAWGYDPGYSYVYDIPVFAYNDLPPDRVIVNVQVELGRLGYYGGAADGLFGPMTRSALRGFQGDCGLPITGAVDEATLYALRLT